MNKNDLIPGIILPPDVDTYIKENKKNDIRIDNSDVTFNVNIQQPQLTAEDVKSHPTTGRFSRDYYQLLVSYDNDIFKNKIITFPANRVLCKDKVPDEIYESCHKLDKSGIDILKGMLAIVCIENNVPPKQQTTQKAWVCAIKAVHKKSLNTKVLFEPIVSFNQSLLYDETYSTLFNTEFINLCKTYWHVKNVDVFEALEKIEIDIDEDKI